MQQIFRYIEQQSSVFIISSSCALLVVIAALDQEAERLTNRLTEKSRQELVIEFVDSSGPAD